MDTLKFAVVVAVIIYISKGLGGAKSYKWLRVFIFSLSSVAIAHYVLGFSLKDAIFLGLTGILIVLVDAIWS
jgi:hypothetical protein